MTMIHIDRKRAATLVAFFAKGRYGRRGNAPRIRAILQRLPLNIQDYTFGSDSMDRR